MSVQTCYEPFLSGGYWFFYIHEEDGPGSVHPELAGHGNILCGPYVTEFDCQQEITGFLKRTQKASKCTPYSSS